MRGMVRDSVLQLIRGKAIYVFSVVTFIACGLATLSRFSVLTPGSDVEVPQELTENVFLQFVAGTVRMLVFLSVLAMSGLIPKMFEKGLADFYLSKPISRTFLLLFKLTATVVSFGSLIVLCTLLTALILAVSLGHGDAGLLVLIGGAMVELSVWLTVLAFIGITTRSQSATVMAMFGLWFAQFFLSERQAFLGMLTAEWPRKLADILYYFLPKFSEINGLFYEIASGSTVTSWQPLASTLATAAILLLATLAIFRRRDY